MLQSALSAPAKAEVSRRNGEPRISPSSRQQFAPLERFSVRVLLAAVGVLLAAAALAVVVLFARSRTGPVHRFDLDSAAHLNRYLTSHRGQVHFWETVTNVGGPTTWRVLAAAGVLVLCVRRRWALAALITGTMLGAAVLSGVTKLAANRARPVVAAPVTHAGGGSFPSGHALTSFVALGLLVLLLLPVAPRVWRVLVVVAAVAVVGLIGVSRLILGVHFVTDVLGGWLIGGPWLTVVVSVFRRTALRRRQQPAGL